MFNTPRIGVRIAHITHQQMEQDDTEVPLTVLTCEVSPFTAALAADLHDFVKRTLFTAKDVEVNGLLASASFNLAVRPQAVDVRMAPDQTAESFTVQEAKLSGIRAKRSKKSSAWTLEFTLSCSPESSDQLGQLVDCYLKMRYLTFSDAEACLFDAEVDETPQLKRKRGGASAGADATH